MIDFVSIRNAIIGGLSTHLGLDVVEGNSNFAKEDYPYVSFVITSTFSGEFENPKSEIYDDGVTTRKEDGRMVISFNAHSLDYDEAHTVGLDAISYFEFIGSEELYESNIVVVDTDELEDRNILIVDEQERRLQFDATFRIESVLEKNVTNIDEANVDINIL